MRRLRAIVFGTAVPAGLAALAAGCGGSDRATTVTVTTAPTITTQQTVETEAETPTFPDLVKKVRSGVVRLEVTRCGEETGIGTGIIVGPRLVATVEHVVDSAARIDVRRAGKSLTTAVVIGADRARDLALLRTSKPIVGYRFIVVGRSPQLGEAVAALGYPLGLPLTVTRGTVSGLNRTIPIDDVRRRRLVQTDAALNPGNSGGPLIAVETGEVLGLVDIGSLSANGLAFAVSAQVARPLLAAWRTAPQPIALQRCPGVDSGTEDAIGTPTVYEGRFTSVDRLQRCNATESYVYCSSGPSQRAVRLEVGGKIIDLGTSRPSEDLGGPAMPEGTSFRTPNEAFDCASSYRGISCTDLQSGAYFVLGDHRLIISRAGTPTPSDRDDVRTGYFASVDRLQRCYANDEGAFCTSAVSGKAVQLTVGAAVTYEGVGDSSDGGGPAMQIGSSFRTPAGTVECGSSTRGITCTDVTTGAYFVIGDRHVRINNGTGEVVH
jgi:S1-C subfamily serine protease